MGPETKNDCADQDQRQIADNYMKAMTRQIGHPFTFCAPTLDTSNTATIAITEIVTNSMELSRWEDDGHSAGHEISCLLCNTEVYYHVHMTAKEQHPKPAKSSLSLTLYSFQTTLISKIIVS
jgi:hypothetical protein